MRNLVKDFSITKVQIIMGGIIGGASLMIILVIKNHLFGSSADYITGGVVGVGLLVMFF